MRKGRPKFVSKIMAQNAIIIFVIILVSCGLSLWFYFNTKTTYQVETEKNKVPKTITASTSTKKIKPKKLISPESVIYHPYLVAHAGGDFNGHKHTNSLEALNHSYALGLRYFEIDFSTTKDGKLVLLHDWGDIYQQYFPLLPTPLTLAQFLNSTTTVGFTPLDLIGLKTWLLSHPGTYIIADTKENSASIWSQLARETVDMHKRFIPQVYNTSQYVPTKKFGFSQVILALYMNINTDEEILNFASSTPDVWAISLSKSHLKRTALITKLKKMSVYMYAHVIDDYKAKVKLQALGIKGFYTTFLRP